MTVSALREYGHFIDGSWREPASAARIDVVNPANGELLARVPAGDSSDVNDAVAAAGKAFGKWGKSSPGERQRVLLEIAARIERRAKEFALLETRNVGKPIRESRSIDVPAAVDHFRYFAGVLRHIEGHTQSLGPSMLHFTLREPVGPVAAIVPWNYPLLLAAWKLAPALAAGNTVVLKPAEQTPLTALELAGEV
ncbi:MAG: NAD-dependent aldehyde dehydrogenase, partial [Deltaproteobacteria bacterium]|nr:NAD-dependent aldehyde dehydrogenase [Deltaproteobacteria bacterium]